MGRKCHVWGCRMGYSKSKRKESEKGKIYGFPKDEAKARAWLRALPNNDIRYEQLTRNHGVCHKHFKIDPETEMGSPEGGGPRVPLVPPNYFPDVPKSSVGTEAPPVLRSPNTPLDIRNPSKSLDDAHQDFKIRDSFSGLSLKNFKKELVKSEKYNFLWTSNTNFSIYSAERTAGPVHEWSIFFTANLMGGACKEETIEFISSDSFAGIKQLKNPAGIPHRIVQWSQLMGVCIISISC